MIKRPFKIVAVILAVCLMILLLLYGYFYLNAIGETQKTTSRFFSFVFARTMQNITAGNLYLNLTFDVVEGNLTVKQKSMQMPIILMLS